MDWMVDNWVFILVGIAFLVLHLFGHGGHGGGHNNHGNGHQDHGSPERNPSGAPQDNQHKDHRH